MNHSKAWLIGIVLAVAMIFSGCSGASNADEAADDTGSANDSENEAGADNEDGTENNEDGTENDTASGSFPEQNITVIVPWDPGGGTDLTVRLLAEEMEDYLDTTITVVNTPGASGSIGTQEAWNAKHDGYTIAGNGMMAFTSYPVMGYMEQTFRDWHVWIATFSPNVFAVHPDSGYSDIEELIDAFKNDDVSVGTAGPGSGGHIGMEVAKAALGIDYRHTSYEGGNPAIIATMGREVDVTTQLSMEMIEMLRSGELIGLGSLHDSPFQVSDDVTIPSMGEIFSELEGSVPMGESFGIMVPNDVPDDVVATIDEAFHAAVNSDSVKQFAEENGVDILGYGGQEAQDFLEGLGSTVMWTLYEGDQAEVSPEEFDIPKP